MLTYMLAHLANTLLFTGVFGASFILNKDDEDTATAEPSDDDGTAEVVNGGAGDDLLTGTDPDGAKIFCWGRRYVWPRGQRRTCRRRGQ